MGQLQEMLNLVGLVPSLAHDTAQDLGRREKTLFHPATSDELSQPWPQQFKALHTSVLSLRGHRALKCPEPSFHQDVVQSEQDSVLQFEEFLWPLAGRGPQARR